MPASQAFWTTSDEVAFIEYLRQHRAESGDGASFKSTTFNSAAQHLESWRTKGAKKSAKSCQNKWSSLRKIFRAIQAIKSQSGWTWSDENGANITPEMEGEWNTFILKHKEAKPFKNHGWVHLKNMTDIMPATLRGAYVFAPIGGTVGMSQSVGAPASQDPPAPDEPSSLSSDGAFADPGVSDHEIEADEPGSPAPDAGVPVGDSQGSQNESERQASAGCSPELPLKHCHDASESSSTPGSKKKNKMTGADAIEGLTNSLNKFSENICKVLSADTTLCTPHRRKEALKNVQHEKWLGPVDQLALFNFLQNNIGAVDAYASLDPEDEDWRHAVIGQMLEDSKAKANA